MSTNSLQINNEMTTMVVNFLKWVAETNYYHATRTNKSSKLLKEEQKKTKK